MTNSESVFLINSSWVFITFVTSFKAFVISVHSWSCYYSVQFKVCLKKIINIYHYLINFNLKVIL